MASEEKSVEKPAFTTGDNKDCAWGWVVAFAGALSVAFSMGIYRSSGVLLVELMEVFEAPTSETSVLMASFGISFTTSALLLNTALGGVFHERALVTIGTIVGCCGLVMTYFATRLEFVTIGFGLCLGVNAQTSLTSSHSLTARYFQKRLSLANGIVLCGTSIGVIALSVFIRYLLDEYTYRGTSLILGGVLLNSLVCAALMRPFPGTTIVDKTAKHVRMKHMPKANSLGDEDSKYQPNEFTKKEDITKTVNVQIPNAPQDIGACPGPSLARPLEIQPGDDVCETSESADSRKQDTLQSAVSLKCKLPIPSLRTKTTDTLKWFLLLKPEEGQQRRSLKDIFALGLLREPMFLLFQLYTFMDCVSSQYALQFYPAVTRDLGFAKYQSAYLLSVIGISSIIGRLFFGFIGDLVSGRYKIVIGALTVYGTAVSLCRLALTFWSQALYATTLGLTYGVTLTYRMSLIRDFFPDDNPSKVVALSMCMDGLGMVIGNPLIGWIRDLTGGYEVPMYMVTSMLFVNCLILLLISVLRCRHVGKRRSYDVKNTPSQTRKT